MGLCKKIYPFPIGSYYCNGQFVRYCDIADTPAYTQDELPEILTNIREKLVAGVDKRLDADTPVGFLLSGGWIPVWSAPLPPKSSASRSVPLPSA